MPNKANAQKQDPHIFQQDCCPNVAVHGYGRHNAHNSENRAYRELGTAYCGNIRNASFHDSISAQFLYEICLDLCVANMDHADVYNIFEEGHEGVQKK